MWISIVVLAGLSTFVAIQLRCFPPPWAAIIITIRNGVARRTKGRLHADCVDQLAEIFKEEGIANGFVAVTAGKRIVCSRGIPPSVQQRVRNVLVNRVD